MPLIAMSTARPSCGSCTPSRHRAIAPSGEKLDLQVVERLEVVVANLQCRAKGRLSIEDALVAGDPQDLGDLALTSRRLRLKLATAVE